MKVCVLGHNGFVGRAVCAALPADWQRCTNPRDRRNIDVLINCAGWSSKHGARTDIERATEYETPVIDICRFFQRVLHVSSWDAVAYPAAPYGLLKRWGEIELQLAISKLTIIRLPMLVGPGLRKNMVYDLLYGNRVYESPHSVYNVISTADAARSIVGALELDHPNLWYNVGAAHSVSGLDIADIIGRDVCDGISTLANYDYAGVPVSILVPDIKTSHEYVKEFAFQWKQEHWR